MTEWNSATPAEAARYLGISRQWIHELINRGELRSYPLPGTRSNLTGKPLTRVLRADVERLKEERGS